MGDRPIVEIRAVMPDELDVWCSVCGDVLTVAGGRGEDKVMAMKATAAHAGAVAFRHAEEMHDGDVERRGWA